MDHHQGGSRTIPPTGGNRPRRKRKVGSTLLLEHVFTDADPARLAPAAADLARSRPDAILAPLNAAAVEVRKLAPSTAIVVAVSVDPVSAGLAQSLARPGGNVTGITSVPPEVVGKRVQFLKQLLPDLRRLGLIYNGANPGLQTHREAVLRTAAEFGIEVIDAPMTGPQDLTTAVEKVRAGGAQAVMGLTADNLTFLLRKELSALMRQHRLPSLFAGREYAQDGGMLAYATNLHWHFRRAGHIVDRVLRGAEPAKYPFEQPTELLLVVNLPTAREIGVPIPDHILAGAEEVIE